MPSLTINQLITEVRRAIDAEGAQRWTDDEIVSALSYSHDAMWSRILESAPYYRFQSLPITTASDGTFPIASLSTGSGNSQRRFWRLSSINDGTVQYTETRFQDVPLGTSQYYQGYYPRLYYWAGENFQILPATSVALTVVVSYKPTMLRDYVGSGTTNRWDIPIDFPEGSEIALVYEAAYRLLMKGGAEANTSALYLRMATQEMDGMLDDLRRTTINPTRLAYSDGARNWAG